MVSSQSLNLLSSFRYLILMVWLNTIYVGGCGTRGCCGWSPEEEDIQEVCLQRSRSRCSSRHVYWWSRQALPFSYSQKVKTHIKLRTRLCKECFMFCSDSYLCLKNWFRFSRGLTRKPMALIKKLRKAVSHFYLSVGRSWMIGYVISSSRLAKNLTLSLHFRH